MVSKVDDVDWRLLLELQQNARTSYSELGRRVGLTAPAVAERVRRLEETGIIKGYRVDLDVERLGYTVTAVIRLQIPEGGCARFARIAPEFPEIHECYRITGSDFVRPEGRPALHPAPRIADRPAGDARHHHHLHRPLHAARPPPGGAPGRPGHPGLRVPRASRGPRSSRWGRWGRAPARGPHAVPAVIPNGRRPVASRATR